MQALNIYSYIVAKQSKTIPVATEVNAAAAAAPPPTKYSQGQDGEKDLKSSKLSAAKTESFPFLYSV